MNFRKLASCRIWSLFPQKTEVNSTVHCFLWIIQPQNSLFHQKIPINYFKSKADAIVKVSLSMEKHSGSLNEALWFHAWKGKFLYNLKRRQNVMPNRGRFRFSSSRKSFLHLNDDIVGGLLRMKLSDNTLFGIIVDNLGRITKSQMHR